MKITENRVFICGASLFLFMAGLNIMFDPTEYTPYMEAMLYIVISILCVMLVIMNKVGERKRR